MIPWAYITGGVLALGAAATMVQTVRLQGAQTALEASRREMAQHLEADARAALAASEAARRREQQWQREMDDVRSGARASLEAARRDAAAAAGVADRLRAHVAALAAACAGSNHPPAAAGGAPAAGPGLVLAELFTRADGRAGELAAYADQARTAGAACERAYDALRRP